MVWAAAYLPVPMVVALEDVDDTTVLHDRGDSVGTTPPTRRGAATGPRWCGPSGEGLAAFHGAVGRGMVPLPLRRRRGAGPCRAAAPRPGGWTRRTNSTRSTRHLTAASALARLEATAPDEEDLVVCHGDYCPPNVLLADGRVTGYVDLGELGRGRPLVGHQRSGLERGMELRGRSYEPLFYESYGVEPDPDRIRVLPPALRTCVS